jgi:hypothetical protein
MYSNLAVDFGPHKEEGVAVLAQEKGLDLDMAIC